uniref:Uncharacterized protein n=1 Tax=Coccidioides posadasii RMSCC 3488 TaxID=454284 RepID=A0A0J6FDJ3_COCPO|nr:hypothetical protein CPAG_07463 [Coccidioides posadasii RMSCC 3488]
MLAGQRPTQSVGGLVSPSAQPPDSSNRLYVVYSRRYSVVQSADFSEGTYVGGREISITSNAGNFFQSVDFFTIKCPTKVRAMEVKPRDTWRPFSEGKREKREVSEWRQ